MGDQHGARVLAAAVGVVALALAATACTGATQAAGGRGREPVTGLSILVPNSPGSGYDTTARTAARVLEDARLARNVEVFNVAGAGGAVGLQRLVNENANPDLIMQMGLGVVGAVYTNKAKASLTRTTPLARLVEEAEAIVVPKNSPYRTLADLLTDWKANPARAPVGGASAPGGPDHLTPMLLAKAAGLNPKNVTYVGYDGGGELLAALLGGKVAAGATGVGEIAKQANSGDVRVLAVTSDQRIPDLDAPTLEEAGIDLVFTNWRGLIAPPGITEEQKADLIGLVTTMHDSQEWKDALAKNGWTDAFVTGADFERFLTAENDRVAGVLTELGLA
jgi:putative tricarboxylic transport membrane protein